MFPKTKAVFVVASLMGAAIVLVFHSERMGTVVRAIASAVWGA